MVGTLSTRVVLVLLLAVLMGAGRPAKVSADEGRHVLAVPYRSQLDADRYAGANCGPASLAMALGAFGIDVPTRDLRTRVNQIQGTAGDYDSGTTLEAIAQIGEEHGLHPFGLLEGKKKYRQWTLDEIRAELRRGHVFIPQVHYRSLPGHEDGNPHIDHFVILTGVLGDRFVYSDPAFPGWHGTRLTIGEERLRLAWEKGDYPYAAVAFAGPVDRPTAKMLGKPEGWSVEVAASPPSPTPQSPPQTAPEPLVSNAARALVAAEPLPDVLGALASFEQSGSAALAAAEPNASSSSTPFSTTFSGPSHPATSDPAADRSDRSSAAGYLAAGLSLSELTAGSGLLVVVAAIAFARRLLRRKPDQVTARNRWFE
ncbi:MAG: C39 family peptidase [Chloroflexi bacterium]|nr:C39 family peptidase [Chloroflexota bacterium]